MIQRTLSPLVLPVALLSASCMLASDVNAGSVIPSKRAAEAAAPAATHCSHPDFAELAARAMPAVVSIRTQGKVKLSRGRMQVPEPFRQFFDFGPQGPREHESRGLGSGFVIEESGLILTNAHVVENADEIEVIFAQADGTERTLAAKVLGQAPEYDVALLKTEQDANAPTLPLGDSEAVRVGDSVMAIGNPFGLDHSVSVGIVSAKERRDIAPSGRRGLYNFLQTDASINPGNSGGPLLSTQGEVIGINSAINAQGQGIGFAIPIDMVKEMLPQLRKGGKFVRSWIGVKIQPLTPELAESYGIGDTHGVLVAEVVPGSPAQKAGLEEGDVLREFDGKRIVRASDLPLYASMAGVGKKVDLGYIRGKKQRELSLELGAFPDEEVVEAGAQDGGEPDGGFGLALADLTPELRERLSAKAERGAVIQRVASGSPAQKAGLVPGDVVLELDGKDVKGARDLVRALDGKKKGDIVRVLVEREGSRIFVAMRKQ